MGLKINCLKLENIRVFKSHEFNFKSGLNIITGPNGAGKSTIITAIGFALFGVDYLNGMKIKFTDLIMRGCDEGKIELIFSTNEGNYVSEYLLSRKTSKTNWILKRNNNEDYFINGISETKNEIKRILGKNIDHNTFKRALCSRQGELTDLLDDEPAKRYEQIKKILGLEKFTKAKNGFNYYNTKVNNEINELKNLVTFNTKDMIDVEKIKINIEKNQRELNINMNKISELEKNIVDKKLELEELIKISTKVNNQKIRIDELKKRQEEIRMRISEYKKELSENFVKLKLSDRNYQEDELDSFIINLEDEIDIFEEELWKLKKKLENKKNVEQKINEIKNDMTKLLEKIKIKLGFDFSQLQDNIELSKENQMSLNTDINDLNEKLKDIDANKNKFEGKLIETKKIMGILENENMNDKCPICENNLTIENKNNLKNKQMNLMENYESKIDEYREQKSKTEKNLLEKHEILEISNNRLDLMNAFRHDMGIYEQMNDELGDLKLQIKNIDYEVNTIDISKSENKIKLNKNKIQLIGDIKDKIKYTNTEKIELDKNIKAMELLIGEISDISIENNELEKTKLKKVIKEYEEDLRLKEREQGNYLNEISNLNQKYEEGIRLKNELNELNKKVKENEKLVMIGESIKNIYSRVPELIIQSISENISNFITQKMNDLLSGHGFERAILTYEGDIEVYSKNQKIDKRTLSGGEFTILGLILRIALADFVAKLDFLILDEPTNHLDDRRVNEFIEMVDKDNIFESSKGQLIIVTHREEFGRNAKNTIHVNVRGNQREVIA